MRQKQPAVALAFNRQHTRGTAPTRLQPADVATRGQVAPYLPVLQQCIPSEASRGDALRVLTLLQTLIDERRWRELSVFSDCADSVAEHFKLQLPPIERTGGAR